MPTIGSHPSIVAASHSHAGGIRLSEEMQESIEPSDSLSALWHHLIAARWTFVSAKERSSLLCVEGYKT